MFPFFEPHKIGAKHQILLKYQFLCLKSKTKWKTPNFRMVLLVRYMKIE